MTTTLCSLKRPGLTNKKSDLVSAYRLAKSTVLHAGYGPEIAWQESLRFEDVTESDFLREHAWVVLSTGMRESVIRKHFSLISHCFYDWESSRRIVTKAKTCRERALQHFNHPGKVDAIIHAAHLIDTVGFVSFKDSIRQQPFTTLQVLPFIGPITSRHLAKNLGLPFAKADRHLVRLARVAGYSDVQEFCKAIFAKTGDSIQVVDVVLWRFAIIERSYLKVFRTASA